MQGFMANTILEVQQISKKFRRGELYNTLRDLVPALSGKLFGNRSHVELERCDFWALRDVSFGVDRG